VMRNWFIRPLAGLVLVSVVACAPPAPSAPPPNTTTTNAPPAAVGGGVAVVRLGGDWGNPVDGGQTVTSAPGGMLAQAMYDRLIDLDPKSGQALPYLATSWTVTPNSVTFKIRQDATCSDGTAINASVVYNSFARFISPDTKSRWPTTIYGAGPYTISKDDAAQTFTFATPQPFNNLLQAFAWYWTGIVCPAGLQPGADFTAQSYGSGPYVFKSATQGNEYVVTKRQGWNWGPQGISDSNGRPDTVTFKVITNETTAANLLLTGGLDIASIGGPDQTRLSNEKAALTETLSAGYAPYTLQINEAPGRPGTDQAVRQAMLTAVDPNSWNQAALAGTGTVSTNFQSNPGGPCYTDLGSIMPKPDPNAAKQVLLNAGYTAGPDGKMQKNGQPLTITVLGSTTNGSSTEYMASALDQAGFTTVLNVTDYNSFAQAFGKTDYDIVVGLFGAPLPVPANTANFFTGKFPPDGNNRLNRDDPKLATLVASAYAAPPGDAACAAWKDLNSYMITNFIALPWVSPATFWYAKKDTFRYAALGATLDPPTIVRVKQ
jgi:peptide/nickel transport system substrate-binding protein